MGAKGFSGLQATLTVFCILGNGGNLGAQETSVPEYFGQTPPGSVPEIFAPGIISEAGFRLHSAVVFSPDLRTVVWSVIPPAVMWTSFMDGAWSAPVTLHLGGRAVQAPTFSADGTRLFYQAEMENGEGGPDIWWVERKDDRWGPPRNVGRPVNSERLESQPSLTSDGVLYFTGTLDGVGLNRGIYWSGLVNGGYEPSELLGSGINSEYIDYCPWISGDESYLLLSSGRPEEGGTPPPPYLVSTGRRGLVGTAKYPLCNWFRG